MPARLDRREQIAEAVSRQLPQSRRVSRGLHDADRASGWWRCSIRSGCASAATGIRAAASRSTCSGKPARRRRAPGSPTRGCPRIVAAADPERAAIRDQGAGARLRRASGSPAPTLAPEARDRAGGVPRRRPAWRHGLAGRPRRGSAATRRRCGRRRAASSRSACPTRPAAIRSRRSPARPRHHLRLCPQPRLSRCAQGQAEAPRASSSPRASAASVKVFVDTAPVMEKPLAAARRPRLAGQAHQPGLARARLLAVSRRDLHHARPRRPTPPHARPLRHLRALPRRLPDRCVPRALPARCHALHLLPDDRAPRPDPARAPPADGQPHLRLRRLPGGLPVEPVRPRRRREAKLRPRADLAAPPLAELAALDDAAFRARFAGSPIKRIGRDRFVRNVLVAIGNSPDPALLPARRPAASDPNPWSPKPPPGPWRVCWEHRPMTQRTAAGCPDPIATDDPHRLRRSGGRARRG